MTSNKPGATAMDPISVRIPDAVRLTGLSRSRIYELMRDGEINFAKVGRSTLIMVEDLRRFIQGRASSTDHQP